jgi:type I restriction enzyme S subunit
MKPYPKYKPSGVEWIGDIPEHWVICSVKYITKFLYGASLKDEARVPGEVPVYGSNGVVGFHNTAITKSPCIVIGRKGSFGKLQFSYQECFPIDTTYFIDQTATKNNLKWLYYLLCTLRLDAYSKDSAVPGLARVLLGRSLDEQPPRRELSPRV